MMNADAESNELYQQINDVYSNVDAAKFLFQPEVVLSKDIVSRDLWAPVKTGGAQSPVRSTGLTSTTSPGFPAQVPSSPAPPPPSISRTFVLTVPIDASGDASTAAQQRTGTASRFSDRRSSGCDHYFDTPVGGVAPPEDTTGGGSSETMMPGGGGSGKMSSSMHHSHHQPESSPDVPPPSSSAFVATSHPLHATSSSSGGGPGQQQHPCQSEWPAAVAGHVPAPHTVAVGAQRCTIRCSLPADALQPAAAILLAASDGLPPPPMPGYLRTNSLPPRTSLALPPVLTGTARVVSPTTSTTSSMSHFAPVSVVGQLTGWIVQLRNTNVVAAPATAAGGESDSTTTPTGAAAPASMPVFEGSQHLQQVGTVAPPPALGASAPQAMTTSTTQHPVLLPSGSKNSDIRSGGGSVSLTSGGSSDPTASVDPRDPLAIASSHRNTFSCSSTSLPAQVPHVAARPADGVLTVFFNSQMGFCLLPAAVAPRKSLLIRDASSSASGGGAGQDRGASAANTDIVTVCDDDATEEGADDLFGEEDDVDAEPQPVTPNLVSSPPPGPVPRAVPVADALLGFGIESPAFAPTASADDNNRFPASDPVVPQAVHGSLVDAHHAPTGGSLPPAMVLPHRALAHHHRAHTSGGPTSTLPTGASAAAQRRASAQVAAAGVGPPAFKPTWHDSLDALLKAECQEYRRAWDRIFAARLNELATAATN